MVERELRIRRGELHVDGGAGRGVGDGASTVVHHLHVDRDRLPHDVAALLGCQVRAQLPAAI